MFYGRTEMKEMYELAVTKKDWVVLLITSELHIEGVLSKDEFSTMLKEWALKIRQCMNQKDAAYRINEGNVFLLTRKDTLDEFLDNLKKSTVISKEGKALVCSSINFLTNEDSEFLLQI